MKNLRGRYEELVILVCPKCCKERTVSYRAERHTSPFIYCQACGISRSKQTIEWKKSHPRETDSPLYKIWSAMRQRCANSKNQSYHRYGGRGITVCAEWCSSYFPFRDWAISNGYAKGLLLDRRDNDGNYEPRNCRWVESAVSAQNTSATKLNAKAAGVIKFLARGGVRQECLSHIYGVGTTIIGDIKTGHAWNNAEPVKVWRY